MTYYIAKLSPSFKLSLKTELALFSFNPDMQYLAKYSVKWKIKLASPELGTAQPQLVPLQYLQ
jgi:hypothetical protein